jgi:hypothetical protein
MKQIFIRFEAKKTCFIRLFRNEANKRILNSKQIETEANILFLANILFISLQSEM